MSKHKVGVVLAHGAWADGSSWNKVIAGLRDKCVKAVAAPLPLTSLAEDVAALDGMLERVEGPVVVVGNAYAGAVIGSTTDQKVAALVYIAALAPDEGETVSDVYYLRAPHPHAPLLGRDRHGRIWLPEPAFARAFAPHASQLEQALLAATQRPIAAECLGVPVPRPAWKDRPSWFLVAEEDRMISAETQCFMAERMHARVRVVPTDHMPMVTAPPAVVDIVLEAVCAIESRG